MSTSVATDPHTECDAETVWIGSRPIDLRLTLRALGHGALDPCHRWAQDGALWRTTRMPDGPATMRLLQQGAARVRCQAWGAGAAQAIASVPQLIGDGDDPATFDPAHHVIREMHARHQGLRVPRSGRVFEAMVPVILEQRVTTREAHDSWRRLVHWHGEAAPGPAPSALRVAPTADGWSRIPSWDWHRAGVDVHRAMTAVSCARVAHRIDECADLPRFDAYRRLHAIRGIGPWTVAEVAQRALGDADAVSVGDFHLAKYVGFALEGRPASDERMLELLEPFRGHRYRAIRLLQLSGFRAPMLGQRAGPRRHLHF